MQGITHTGSKPSPGVHSDPESSFELITVGSDHIENKSVPIFLGVLKAGFRLKPCRNDGKGLNLVPFESDPLIHLIQRIME